MDVRMTIGTEEKHLVEAAYDPARRTFRLLVDGHEIYRHGGAANGAKRAPAELRAGDREVHTLIVEPPGVVSVPRLDPACYRIWLDGHPVADVATIRLA